MKKQDAKTADFGARITQMIEASWEAIAKAKAVMIQVEKSRVELEKTKSIKRKVLL